MSFRVIFDVVKQITGRNRRRIVENQLRVAGCVIAPLRRVNHGQAFSRNSSSGNPFAGCDIDRKLPPSFSSHQQLNLH